MRDTRTKKHDRDERDPEAENERRGVEPSAQPPLTEDADSDVQTELEILRGELALAHEQLTEARRQADDMRDRYLRARADLDNVRRRAAGDVERAREAGLDSAVIAVLTVFDDLSRALQVADEDDPSKIIPGVQAVLGGLERNLESLDIRRVGAVGDPFDPDLHEALTSRPSDDPAKVDTIAEVYQVGFSRGDRLVRPARVVVYQS